MKYFTSLIPLILIIFSCSSSPKDCSRFKTGTFKYSDPVYGNITLVRNDSVQTEIDTINNTKIVGTIEWVSDCKYILTYKSASNLALNNLAGKQIEVDIVEVDNKGYKCIISNGSRDLTWMVKID